MIARFRETGADVKWVETESLHVTLKFLGEVGEPGVNEVRAALRSVRGASFRLGVRGIGTFPPRGRPRVIWLGLTSADPLAALAATVERVLEPLGFPPEGRPFKPHVTLGRVRSPAGLDRLDLASLRERAFGSWTVEGVSLMESRLSSKGPTYLEVEQYPLS